MGLAMNRLYWRDPDELRRTAGRVYGSTRVRYQTADGKFWTAAGLEVPNEVRLLDERSKLDRTPSLPDTAVLPYYLVPPSIDRLADTEEDAQEVDAEAEVDGDAPQLDAVVQDVPEQNLEVPDADEIAATRERAELQALSMQQLREVLRGLNDIREAKGMLPVGAGNVTKAEIVELLIRTQREIEAEGKA